jgi:hypothetical protein
MMTRDEAAARALPAIGEDARVLLALGTPAGGDLRLATPAAAVNAPEGGTPPRSPPMVPSLSPSSSSRASSVSSSSSSLLAYGTGGSSAHRLQRRGSRRDGAAASPQPVCYAYNSSSDVRPLRRRFLSSDVALKPSGAASNLPGGHFLSPLTRLRASSSTSSLSLRRWVTAKASAVRGGITRSLSLNRYPSAAGDGVPTAGPWDDGVFEPERPRTRSENFLNLVKRSHMHPNSLNLFPVEGGADEEEDSDLSDDDGSNSSVSSSMEDAENAGDVANVNQQPRELSTKEQQEKLEKLHNLQRLLQEGFITVTEYKDRHVQLVGEASAVTEPSTSREAG